MPQGVPVSRFDVVKALGRDPLLGNVFKLIAERQKRGEALFYRAKRNEFTGVLKRLQIVANLPDGNSKVDRMWERLMEIVLFSRSKKHRTPVEILKSFIKSGEKNPRLEASEQRHLRKVFRFLNTAYKTSALAETRLATDQPQFYTMITSLLGDGILTNFPNGTLIEKMTKFGQIIDGKLPTPKDKKLPTIIKKYQELSARQTTNVGRREERQEKFIEAINAL